MAQEESGQERTEEPTQKKLDEARKKGEIPRSRELNAMAVMILGSLGCILTAGPVFEALKGIFKRCMDLPRDAAFDKFWLSQLLFESISEAFYSLAPLFIILLITTLLTPGFVGGWNFSLKALAPKMSKMNPLKGLKRMFSAHSLMELVKSIGKFVLVAGFGLLAIYHYKEQLMGLGFETVEGAITHAVTILGWSFFMLTWALVFIAAIDVPFQIFQNKKQMKMTKQEVKDEHKDTEGKPEVKGRIRQAQREMSQRRMMAAVPDADVVITNPTHYAVALKYDPENMNAPILLAKGTDFMAEQIRKIAKEHKIAMLTAPPLARSIYYHTKLEQEIPAGLYVAVAQILAYVFQLKAYQEGKADNPGVMPSVEVPDHLRRDE
ncbi:MAG: flagellar biosynthesis protein FlhB [Pseudomonadales bacterium]|nr:flagellar biosynthesis protein FlhB [Pseudomonadales bacterium]